MFADLVGRFCASITRSWTDVKLAFLAAFCAHVILTTHPLETKINTNPLSRQIHHKIHPWLQRKREKGWKSAATTGVGGGSNDLLFETSSFGAVLFISGGEEQMLFSQLLSNDPPIQRSSGFPQKFWSHLVAFLLF